MRQQMAPSSQKLPAKDSQRARFIETARALGADEDEATFKEKLGRIARQKPKAEQAAEPKKLKRG
jgi:hypothetical protein